MGRHDVGYPGRGYRARRDVPVDAPPRNGQLAGLAKWQTSTAGGTEPRWRSNGTELYYRAADEKLMVVGVRTQPGFEHEQPRVLFPVRMSRSGYWHYDVTPDGQRFVISLAIGEEVPPPINIVLNWTAGLPR